MYSYYRMSYNEKQHLKKGRNVYRFSKEFIERGLTLKEIEERHKNDPEAISFHTLKQYCREYNWVEKRKLFQARQAIIESPDEEPKLRAKAMAKHWRSIEEDALFAIQNLDPLSETYASDMKKLMAIVKEARLMERLEQNQPNSLSASAVKTLSGDSENKPKRPRNLIQLTDANTQSQAIPSLSSEQEVYLPGRGETIGENDRGSGDNEEKHRPEEDGMVSEGVSEGRVTNLSDYSAD